MIDKPNSPTFSSYEEEILFLRERMKGLESACTNYYRSYQALQTLAKQSSELIFWEDKELNVLGYNKAVEHLLETAGESSVATVFSKIPSFVADVLEVIKSGEASEGNTAEAVIGEKQLVLQYAVYPYSSTQEEVEGIVCIASIVPDSTAKAKNTSKLNITAAHRIEELTNANEQLRKVNTDLDNFIYTASHDLRSPIANLEGLVTLLSKSLENKLDEDERTMFNMMQKAVNRFKSTISDLTQIISIDKDFAEGSEALYFSDLIEHVQIDIGQLMRESGAVVTLDAQVPSILFARKNLRSIIYNLLINAIKYRSPEKQLQIHIKTRQEGEYIVLSIQDNGLGIRADQKDKLFAMFHRVHTHIEGTGIGLYVVKRIVENNKGKIEVDSEVGKGTTFHVYLLSDADRAPKAARSSNREKR
jgi:signal transduction histidine kinase